MSNEEQNKETDSDKERQEQKDQKEKEEQEEQEEQPQQQEDEEEALEEKVIDIRRVSTVAKGGRRMSFNAVVVVGDERGRVGLGFGKAPEVASAIPKASNKAKKKMFEVPIIEKTIPHAVENKFSGSKVVLKPANKGTGVIAGSVMRAVLETTGIDNILTKALGSTTPLNLARSTINALKKLESPEDVAERREIPVSKVKRRYE